MPWLLILAVVAVALVVVFDMVGNDPVRTAADGAEPEVAVTEPTETESTDGSVASEDEGDDGSEDEKAADEKPAKKEPNEASSAPDLITKGIEIQVLNGTGDGEADDLMADKLARLGYTVVAVSPSSAAYPKTVVFWTGNSEKIGAALAERLDWVLKPAPSNLSSEVHLHVVVGEDAL